MFPLHTRKERSIDRINEILEESYLLLCLQPFELEILNSQLIEFQPKRK